MSNYITFPEGKTKALTMSYDDGRQADKRLIALFNQYGIRGTFNLCSSWLLEEYPDPQERSAVLRSLYKNHEVATHSLSHPTMERLTLSEVANEILEDRKNLEKIFQYPVIGHAYPNGSYTKEIEQLLQGLGIAYARVVPSSNDFELPKNLYEWQPTCHHSDPTLMKKAEFFADFNKKQYLKLMYVWGHSYEFDRDNTWNVIKEFCEFMGGRDDIWYATNIEIVQYMEAARRLQFSADGSFVYNPGAITVWVNANGTVYEIPGGTQIILEHS